MNIRKNYDPKTPYQTIDDAARTTGLSRFFLRNGCKDHSLPCLQSGRTYYVNVPALLEQMDELSKKNMENK